MTTILGLLACLAPFGVAAWYRDGHNRRRTRDTEGALDDARAHIRRLDRHRGSLAVQTSSLRARVDSLETDLAATQVIAANHLRRAWRAERALVAQSAEQVVAEAEAVVHAVEAGT